MENDEFKKSSGPGWAVALLVVVALIVAGVVVVVWWSVSDKLSLYVLPHVSRLLARADEYVNGKELEFVLIAAGILTLRELLKRKK